MEKCDLLDVLLYIAYETPAVERIRRVELVKQDWIKHWTRAQADFLTIILDYYAKNGYKELGEDKLSSFIDIKYGSTSDAARALQMGAKEIRQSYLDLQHELYDGPAIQQLAVQGDVYFQGNTSVGTIHG